MEVGRAAKQVTGLEMQCSLTVNFNFFSARVYEVEGAVYFTLILLSHQWFVNLL